MNLARLERMVAEGDLSRDALRYLLDCRGECEWLDYKEVLPLATDEQVCSFAKDALAMKNVGGGYLLVGVLDKSWQQIGLEAPFPLDTKQLRDKVFRATGATIDVDVVNHSVQQENGRRYYPLILVRSSRKRSRRRRPTVVGKDFCAAKHFGLRRGEIFVRRGDSTVRISSQQELEALLEHLEDEADRHPEDDGVVSSPFAVENGTYRLLDRGFERFIGREELRQRLYGAILGDPRIWIIDVHGPGGVGKSALVNWATHKLYEERQFEAMLQLTAKESILTDAGIQRFSRSLYSLENLLDQILLLFEEDPDCELITKKRLAIELLSAWRTLLVLDNLETVSDGRILAFAQSLPPQSKARVVLTSRTKTGGWELPIPVTEMTEEETRAFVALKSDELAADFPLNFDTMRRVASVGGGLPLATQWIVGQYKRTRRLDGVLDYAGSKDSPVLEFCFRNIWNALAPEARTVLAIMSIFDEPVPAQLLVVALEMKSSQVERSLGDLVDVTLVNKMVPPTDGPVLYSTLPITMSFARNELALMGNLELTCRGRVSRYNDQLALEASEVARFRGEFAKYGIELPTEKRAAILCRQAESASFAGNLDGAEVLFTQARELAPGSAYVLAKSASYELLRNHVGRALELASEACSRASKRTGALCFGIKAQVLDKQLDRGGRIIALERALAYEPGDTVLRHQYGVSLSRAGRETAAIEQFSEIIRAEEKRVPPRETLVMALTTRIINLRRLGLHKEADGDIQRARQLVSSYPQLAAAGKYLDDLE
jgi:tetratricopeptide (TPR) repeat protein